MDFRRITPATMAGFLVWLALSSRMPGQVAQSTDAQAREVKGLPPRATPADYQARAQAGSATIAAEFKGHSVPTPEAILSSEDFVSVEVGLFGPPDARAKISTEDFALRVNNTIRPNLKKPPLPAQPYSVVFRSLKDPEWEPAVKAESKTKTNIGGGGGGQGDSAPPAPPKMPFELVRAMEQRVQKASLPEGDRALPQAGLIFFSYRGKTEGLRSIELIYSGPLGKATLSLQP